MAKKPYDIVATLYGSSVEYRRAIAFCRHHHCHLTINQVKTKGCLGKGCKHLDKIPCKYWEQREQKKLLKKGGNK